MARGLRRGSHDRRGRPGRSRDETCHLAHERSSRRRYVGGSDRGRRAPRRKTRRRRRNARACSGRLQRDARTARPNARDRPARRSPRGDRRSRRGLRGVCACAREMERGETPERDARRGASAIGGAQVRRAVGAVRPSARATSASASHASRPSFPVAARAARDGVVTDGAAPGRAPASRRANETRSPLLGSGGIRDRSSERSCSASVYANSRKSTITNTCISTVA